MSLAAEKARARAAALERRAAAHAAGHPAAAALLATALAPHRGRPLAGYLPMRTEIDPRPAMAAWDAPVGVPVTGRRGEALRFRLWTPDAALVAEAFGTHAPEAGDWVAPEVLIVPLVAFDRRGGRLGYGGGFYDRTLAALRAASPVTAIGFAWAAQEADALPLEATDAHLDMIVTEAEVILP